MPIAQYAIITGRNAQELVQAVSEQIFKGWIPQGGPFVLEELRQTISYRVIGQALVRVLVEPPPVKPEHSR